MPELVRDPLRGEWVILAADRAQRPDDRPGDRCPFCPGHEEDTPPATATVPATGSWRLRAFPNRFPLVHDPRTGPVGDGVRCRAVATGSHEVVVLSAHHDVSFADLTDDEAVEALQFLRLRIRDAESRHSSVAAFVNHGTGAGASRAHPHAQIVGLDIALPVSVAEVAALRRLDPCPLCWHGRRQETLVVARSGASSAWCPAWSSAPFEMLIAPDHHRPRLTGAATDLADVAVLLRDGLHALRGAAGDPNYVVAIHSAPDGCDSFHWHVHVWPRLQVPGGFEQGSGLGVNTMPPPAAAENLRSSLPQWAGGS